MNAAERHGQFHRDAGDSGVPRVEECLVDPKVDDDGIVAESFVAEELEVGGAKQ